jgi:hypothetical protein
MGKGGVGQISASNTGAPNDLRREANPMTSEEDLFIAKSMGIGLAGILTDLMVRHVTLIGGDAEQAVRTTREALNESLSSLQATGITPDGKRLDESDNVKIRVAKMLDFVETNVRSKLKLPPLPSKPH